MVPGSICPQHRPIASNCGGWLRKQTPKCSHSNNQVQAHILTAKTSLLLRANSLRPLNSPFRPLLDETRAESSSFGVVHSLNTDLCLPPSGERRDGPRSLRPRRRLGARASSSSAAAVASGPCIALKRPSLVDTAPAKGALPPGSSILDESRPGSGWSLLWPSGKSASSPGKREAEEGADDPRRSIVRAAPRASAAELSTAAQMARLSSLVYYPDPSDRLEALGLELKQCVQTPYTAFFVADGPSDLFQGSATPKEKNDKKEGKTRYIITRGVAFDREEVKWGDLWAKLLHFWPVEFEKDRTPRGMDLLVHGGVNEIAEQVYKALLPHLSFDPKREGITAIRFGGHSLGGSLAVLLMLMFHLRSPVKKGWSTDLLLNSHTFGSFPVVATPFQMPWGANDGSPIPSSQNHSNLNHHNDQTPCVLLRAIENMRRQLGSPLAAASGHNLGEPSCSILSKLGLPDMTAQSFVHDSDIVPRAFLLALKQDAVRGILGLKGRLDGNQGASSWFQDPLEFQPLGLVHYMHSQGEQVSVARLQARLAEKALHMDLVDFVKNPSLIGKSIQDHYFHHYVSRLDSALITARREALMH